jgi:hypothetical protein
MAINQYFDGQKKNLRRSLNWEPFAEIFPLVDKLYVDITRMKRHTDRNNRL